MIKKVIFLISTYFALLIIGLFSCTNKCGPFPDKFKTVGLNWMNYKAIYSDTTDAKLLLSYIENDTVIFNEYAIYIDPQIEKYYAHNSAYWNFSPIQSAYACSPIIPETDERIDSITIISHTDFNAIHRAGSDLSDLFDIVVQDIVNGLYYEKYNLKDYLASNPHVPTDFTLILKEKPSSTSEFQFTVKYYQQGIDNNDYFEFTTGKIVIKRD